MQRKEVKGGCIERKCPCRTWVNCHTYIDRQKQQWRLKRKELDAVEWYRDNFRGDVGMADFVCSG